jgi:hypothetical protein
MANSGRMIRYRSKWHPVTLLRRTANQTIAQLNSILIGIAARNWVALSGLNSSRVSVA